MLNDDKDSEITKHNYKYYLRVNLQEKREVCTKFFFNTLGYTNNQNIYNLFEKLRNQNISNYIAVPEDGRKFNKFLNFSKYSPHSLEFNESIIKFIESKNPQSSNYSLLKSPNTRYIDNDYATKLYKEFCKLKKFEPRVSNSKKLTLQENNFNKNEWCTFMYFNKFLEKISFKKSRVDLCKTCIIHEIQNKNIGHNCNSELCINYIKHKNNINLIAEKTKNDVLLKSDKTVIFSGDMQKALFFPILENKNNFFMRKLVTYNMTFAEYGTDSNVICILSHSAKIEKGANEIFNFYLKFLTSEFLKNMDHIIIKVDNCVAQNKNWLFLSNMVYLVNDKNFGLKIIDIDYLEVGHTHMPADRVHGHIAIKINRTKNIYIHIMIIKIL